MFFQKDYAKKIDKTLMSVFPRLLLFYRGSGVSQRWEFQSTAKNVLRKESCRKVFTQKIDQKSKTDFSTAFVLSRLWAVLGEGSSKTPVKTYIGKINLTMVLFWPLTQPHPPRGWPIFVLAAP
jgi:hypothetical protein